MTHFFLEMSGVKEEIFYPSILDIKQKIPEHCFKSDIWVSCWYVVRSVFLSLVLVIILGYSRMFFQNLIVNVLYVYFQGVIFWGFFTIGHDCGHGAFSRYPKVNWIIGNMLHSFILTPYEPWRLSHQSHHKNTGNLEKDEIFYPNPPPKHVYCMFGGIGSAWFLYLIFGNVPGRRKYFAYFSREFTNKFATLILSFLSIFIVLCGILKAIQIFGLYVVILYYGAPLFLFACWLVVVTFLHHNDELCPWYTNEEWNYLKGALSSVDRDYGIIVNNLSHNINLHQIHHIFPIIPHYHLEEATKAFRIAFPLLVRLKKGSNVYWFFKGLYYWGKK